MLLMRASLTNRLELARERAGSWPFAGPMSGCMPARDQHIRMCAGACVPATVSAVFDFRVLCVSGFGSPARFVRPGRSCGMSRGGPSGLKPDPTFSVGKTHGALSPPRQPIRAGRGAHLSSRRFLSRSMSHRSRVTSRRSRAPGRCTSPLQCAVAQKWPCKSSTMCTYKSLDLKSIRMNTYKKYRGGWGTPDAENAGKFRANLQLPGRAAESSDAA
jgi:hypothetical protein